MKRFKGLLVIAVLMCAFTLSGYSSDNPTTKKLDMKDGPSYCMSNDTVSSVVVISPVAIEPIDMIVSKTEATNLFVPTVIGSVTGLAGIDNVALSRTRSWDLSLYCYNLPSTSIVTRYSKGLRINKPYKRDNEGVERYWCNSAAV